MLNPYTVILGLFVVAGLFATLRGWRIIVKGNQTLNWPSVEGTIEETGIASERDDLLPHILFSYTVNGRRYRQHVRFTDDISPTQEFATSYLDKFPPGSKVRVHYHPEHPEDATLEPGLGRGDRMLFIFGLGMTIVGLTLLFI